MEIPVQILNNSSNELPSYATIGSSGLDLKADFHKGIKEKFLYLSAFDDERDTLLIFPGGRALVPTNIHVALPDNYEFQIRPRSGLAIKHGITVLNTPGTIDSDYRDGIGIILINLSDEVFEVSQGDRIAQAVLSKVDKVFWNAVESLNNTDRGLGGFGSTGKN